MPPLEELLLSSPPYRGGAEYGKIMTGTPEVINRGWEQSPALLSPPTPVLNLRIYGLTFEMQEIQSSGRESNISWNVEEEICKVNDSEKRQHGHTQVSHFFCAAGKEGECPLRSAGGTQP